MRWTVLPAVLILVSPSFTSAAEFAQTLELPPGEHFEQCMHLSPGQSLKWSFNARQPVSFNIHYHHGPEMHHTVQKEGMEGAGRFDAKESQVYCTMWTNRATGSNPLHFSLEVMTDN